MINRDRQRQMNPSLQVLVSHALDFLRNTEKLHCGWNRRTNRLVAQTVDDGD